MTCAICKGVFLWVDCGCPRQSPLKIAYNKIEELRGIQPVKPTPLVQAGPMLSSAIIVSDWATFLRHASWWTLNVLAQYPGHRVRFSSDTKLRNLCLGGKETNSPKTELESADTLIVRCERLKHDGTARALAETLLWRPPSGRAPNVWLVEDPARPLNAKRWSDPSLDDLLYAMCSLRRVELVARANHEVDLSKIGGAQ